VKLWPRLSVRAGRGAARHSGEAQPGQRTPSTRCCRRRPAPAVGWSC